MMIWYDVLDTYLDKIMKSANKLQTISDLLNYAKLQQIL